MPTLAPKLPWQHAFAGGYPRRGGQTLPTDPDAIDYLNRVAAADGASVEVGIAQAIDAFVRGCKADSAGYAGDPTRTNWDAIQASCVMCGARTLSGALVPLKGTAPTPYNFASGDYSRSGATPGLKGNGSTKYLNTNRANNADGQNDSHFSAFITLPTTLFNSYYLGAFTASAVKYLNSRYPTDFYLRDGLTEYVAAGKANATGLMGMSRDNAANVKFRIDGVGGTHTSASLVGDSYSTFIFARNATGIAANFSDGRIAFYSVGSAVDLAALDSRVSTLVSQIAAAIS